MVSWMWLKLPTNVLGLEALLSHPKQRPLILESINLKLPQLAMVTRPQPLTAIARRKLSRRRQPAQERLPKELPKKRPGRKRPRRKKKWKKERNGPSAIMLHSLRGRRNCSICKDMR